MLICFCRYQSINPARPQLGVFFSLIFLWCCFDLFCCALLCFALHEDFVTCPRCFSYEELGHVTSLGLDYRTLFFISQHCRQKHMSRARFKERNVLSSLATAQLSLRKLCSIALCCLFSYTNPFISNIDSFF